MLSRMVVYGYVTDNSGMGECGTMGLFHPSGRGLHHGAEPVVLPTPGGCSHPHLPPHPYRAARRTTFHTPAATRTPKRRRTRSTAPKPFPGLIHKPLCEACEQGADGHSKAPGSPPPIIRFTRGRR